VKQLEIRDEQWDAFEEDAQKRFEEKLLEVMRRSWPEACAAFDDEDLRQRVGEAVDRARYHGFTEQEQITRFAHLAFMVGIEFDESAPWAGPILAWDVPAAKKLEFLERAAQEAHERGAS
jgi:hypothetical protein